MGVRVSTSSSSSSLLLPPPPPPPYSCMIMLQGPLSLASVEVADLFPTALEVGADVKIVRYGRTIGRGGPGSARAAMRHGCSPNVNTFNYTEP